MMKVLFALASYLLGSVPTGYLLIKIADRRDIRRFGSRSTGATNVLRVGGLKFALPVMIVDVLKGFIPAFLALKLFHDPALAIVSGFLATVGHCFPFSIGFKGGKGMATSMGAYAALAPLAFLASLAVFALVAAAGRFVSLGSILGSLSFPVFALLFHQSSKLVFGSLTISALIVFRHKDNIKRLIAGTERKLGEKTP
jgi:glycerol-3-phosphate acyltransferase PlsY